MNFKTAAKALILVFLTSCGAPHYYQSNQDDSLMPWVREKISVAVNSKGPKIYEVEPTEEDIDEAKADLLARGHKKVLKIFKVNGEKFTPGKKVYLFYASLPCAEKLGEGVVNSSGKITWTHLPIMKILDADYGEPFRILVISEDQEESATLTIIPQPIIAKDNSNKKLEIEKTEVPYMWIYYLSGFEPNSTIFEKMRLDDEERSEMKEFDENGRMVGILMCNPKITGGSFHLQYIGGLMEKPLEATVYWGSKEEGNPPLLSPIGGVKINPESTME